MNLKGSGSNTKSVYYREVDRVAPFTFIGRSLKQLENNDFSPTCIFISEEAGTESQDFY